MQIPESFASLPTYIQAMLPEEEYPGWSQRVAQTGVSMLGAGFPPDEVARTIMSLTMGAVWALQDKGVIQ